MPGPLEIRVDASIADTLALGVVVLGDVDLAAGADAVVARLSAELAKLLGSFAIVRVGRRPPAPQRSPLLAAVACLQVQERLSYGLFDLDAIEPPIVARTGSPGEGYEAVHACRISVEGRPALFDARGPFGHAACESERAKVTDTTRRALLVIFGSPGTPYVEWEGVLDRTVEVLLLHVSATVVERRVVLGGAA